ncbi:MAG: thiol:disulfide interchange protein DsbD [Candidatus Azotimanducaceae bacterium]|jgi:thiol:disulfide interchange protein DsbD
MEKSVAELGYRPEIAPSRIGQLEKRIGQEARGAIPEPVSKAVIEAGEAGKLVFVDFHAKWCGACKILDRTTFKDPAVIKTLVDFVFLKVDADEYPDALRYFDVVGMPTLIVLNMAGEEVYRQVGPISADNLKEALLSVRSIEAEKNKLMIK